MDAIKIYILYAKSLIIFMKECLSEKEKYRAYFYYACANSAKTLVLIVSLHRHKIEEYIR